MVGPSFGAIIAEQSDEANRGKAFGVSEGIFMVVAVSGPPLGGILADRYGFKLMFLAAGLLYGSAAVLRFWMANQVRRTSEGSPQALSLPSLRARPGARFGLRPAEGSVRQSPPDSSCRPWPYSSCSPCKVLWDSPWPGRCSASAWGS